MRHGPPVAKLALSFAIGVSWGLTGAPIWSAPLAAVSYLAAPATTSSRPGKGLWVVVALVGWMLSIGSATASRCVWPEAGSRETVSGRFLARPVGGSAPFRLTSGCPAFTVVTTDTLVRAGVPVALEGTWMSGRRRPWFRATGGDTVAGNGSEAGLFDRVGWAFVRWRDHLGRRIERLYGPRAPLVSALTLARREGLDPDLREAFARSGIAHLLAISGFHVGVIAGFLMALLRALRVSRRRAGLAAAAVAWFYVAVIGFPDAACRAASILMLAALAKSRGRPPARWGALATALLALLLVDPAKMASAGFQLSFAGAAGLVAWSKPLTSAIAGRLGRLVPRTLSSALGAGVAATVATLPVVAWHFERVSLVGIPMTLLATPLVSVALPGAIVSVLVDPLAPGLASFIAEGVLVLLAALQTVAEGASECRWASVWVTRPSVVAAVSGVAIALVIARHPRVGGRSRRALTLSYVLSGFVVWPFAVMLGGWGTLEVITLDVGQGDAIALRSPRGRWMLVDAGPPSLRSARESEEAFDPRAHPVVRALAARGVSRIETLVLTHPDLDHIGGARAVLESFDVNLVYDPALPAGKVEYVDLLSVAAEAGVAWRAARQGQVWDFDGVSVEVLHPEVPFPQGAESNELSVVLHVRYGAFDVLLTGDAYKETERVISHGLEGVEVLKLGHHGSDTSTDSLLLARARPEIALASLGRANRYGHPDPAVLSRLEAAGIPLLRTDQVGTISITARRDGSYTVRSERREPGRGR